MTTESLKFINDLMESLEIPYEYMEWESASMPNPFFVGSYVDNTTETHEEDGSSESVFTLYGVGTTWMVLEEVKDKLININETAILPHGSIAVYFNNSQHLPSEDGRLKRIQIQLTVKEWSVI